MLLILVLLGTSGLAQAAKRPSARPRREVTSLSGPSDEMIWDNGLMEKSVTSSLLLEKGSTYHELTGVRKFKGQVLAYVTPWNRKGYDLALTFRHKLTHVSPVWYQLKKGDGNMFVLEGGHNMNRTWLDGLKAGDVAPRVVPRIILDLKTEEVVSLLQHPQQAVQLILTEVHKQHYDGIVLEAWMQWVMMGGLSNDMFQKAAFAFIQALHGVLHMQNFDKELILAVPPLYPAHHKAGYTDYDYLSSIQEYVDGWSIMTYDYSTAQGTAGPNAPLPWLTANCRILADPDLVQRTIPLGAATIPRLWLGLNFYGYDFIVPGEGGQPIVASEYLALLKAHAPSLQWDDDAAEHSFEYTDGSGNYHRVFFPTPRSVETRLELVGRYNFGVSIWELGQGLERFMDLL